MSDVDEYQELNIDDISVDDFKNFETSDDIENAFNSTEFENMTFDEYTDDEGVIGATGDMSGDFSFGEYSDGDIAAMFEGGEDGKQEPYFETQTDGLADVDTSFANAFETTEEYAEQAPAEEYVAEEYAEPVMTEEYVEQELSQDFANAFEVTEEYAEQAPVEEYVAEEYAEPVMTEEYVEPVIAPTVVSETETFNGNDFIDDAGVDNISAYNVETSQNLKYLQWYSGSSSAEVYEFGKSSASGEFIGSKECNTVHVNVGYDTYGWIVQFSDGVIMSLRDVREYQIRNGKLPNNSGRIVYGQNTLSFEKVERIVVYEAVKYFSYGM